MGVHALIPVQEALHVHDIAHVQSLDGLIHVGAGAAEVALYHEGVDLVVQGHIEVQVVTLGAGAVPVVQEGSAGIVGGGHGHTLEGDLLVLVGNQLVGTQPWCPPAVRR